MLRKDTVIKALKDTVKTLLIFAVATGLTYFLSKYDMQTENLLLVYMLGVIMVIVETRSRVFGIASSVLFVLSYDFLFVFPRFRFTVSKSYYSTIAVFLIVAIVVSVMAHRVNMQSVEAKRREKVTRVLYDISNSLLNISGIEEIISYGEDTLSDIAGCKVQILYGEETVATNPFAKWCFQNSCPCGAGEADFSKEEHRYAPIRYKRKTVGVVVFDCEKSEIDEQTWNIVRAVISQLSLSIERDTISTHEQETQQLQNQELVKINLLKNIAHDLQTPLTQISTSANTLAKRNSTLTGKELRELSEQINSATDWLCNTAENLVNVTNISSNDDLELNKEECAVSEIVNSVASAVASRVYNHTFLTMPPKEDFTLEADKQLVAQALTNVIDNALRHTDPNCDVILKYEHRENKAVFQVADNGGGIDEGKMSELFNLFTGDGKIGIGLSVSKYIVEEHGGTITMFNNHNGGVTVEIVLPVE